MIKLIASDLDGTLLQNGARTLSDTVIEQIKQLKKNGNSVCGSQRKTVYKSQTAV